MKYTVTLDNYDICIILTALSTEADRRKTAMDVYKGTDIEEMAKQQYEDIKTAYDNLKLEREFAIRREEMTCEVKSLEESYPASESLEWHPWR